ncbi:MAG: solute carrier family 23 protein [Euryarchaeota archaeon]|nr:solute carrier family 23 protein [Euryarchaeota archaeon]
MPKKPPGLVYGVDDDPPRPTCFLLGLQHVSVISIALILPVVIVRAIGGTFEMAEFMVSMSILAGGIGTILQALNKKGVGSGYLCPSVCGPSYLSASLLAANTGGLSLLFGMTAVAGCFEVILSRVMHRLRALFPAEVTGVVVAMVGIAVIPLAVTNFMGLDATDTVMESPELVVAFVTLATMVGINVWGKGRSKLYSVLIGMTTGYIAAYLLGVLDYSHILRIWDAPLVAFPDLSYFGWSFDHLLLAPFLIAITCSCLKSVGDLTTCQRINDTEWKRPDMKNIGRGILADGLSAIISGLVGAMGQSTSSSNVGLSIGTGATSRKIAFATGSILIILAFVPKLAKIFVIMPKPVMGATLIYAVSFMIVAGFQIITSRMLDARKTFVVGIPIIVGLSVDVVPGLYDNVHPWIHPIFSSSLSLATVLVILLNLILRIGIAQRQQLILKPGVDTTDTIFAFMEQQGAAWGARKDVIYRAISAMNEFFESVSISGLTKGDITADVGFDEFNLDIDIRYHGTLMEFPATRPTEADLLKDEKTVVRLSGFMIMQYADTVRSDLKDDLCHVQLHFDH